MNCQENGWLTTFDFYLPWFHIVGLGLISLLTGLLIIQIQLKYILYIQTLTLLIQGSISIIQIMYTFNLRHEYEVFGVYQHIDYGFLFFAEFITFGAITMSCLISYLEIYYNRFKKLRS